MFESVLKDLQDAAETGVTVGTANTVGNVTTVGLTLSSTFDKSFTFTLPTLSDTLVEGSESFTVAASNAAASNGASATASGSVITTITDNDTLALSLTGDPTVAEGGAPSYTLAITSGDIPAGSTATVDLSITLPGGLTGAEAADFVKSFLKDLQDAAETGVTVGTANTVGNVTTVGLTLSSTFDKSFTFTLPTLSDTLVEGSESFTVAASNAAASNGASATASGSVITTITDNDTLALSLTGDPTVAEGGAPSYTLAITSGDIPAGSTATVDLSITLPGGLTGAEAADFVKSFLKDLQDAAETGVTVGTANTVGNVTTVGLTLSSTFDKSFTFTLPTLSDTLVEGSESFTVAASNAAASNGASATASGSVITTITDNDTLALSLTGDPTVAEGGAPSYTLAITSGDIPAGSTATVDLSITLPGGLTGAEAADFVESFLKDLQDAAETGVTVGTANTVGNVTTVGLTLSSTFDKSFTFTLPTLSDTLVEGSESFTVAASNAAASNGASATASGSVITTITDNDTLALSLTGDPTVAEGGAPSYTLAITSGDIPAGSTATVDLSITLPGGLTGAEAADFVESFLKDLQDAAETGVTVGTANTVGNVTTVGLTLSSTFDKSFTFTLPTLSDTLVEGSESFTVAASNAAASNGASATASGSVITTITDNDTLALSLTGDPTVAEGGAPSYTLAITSGDIPAGSTATVDLSITLPGGLTGAEAADFVELFLKDLQDAAETGVTVGTANTVGNVTTVGLTLSSTFDKSFTFTLPTLSDTLVEGSESFTVAASNAAASNGASATASGSVITTITDNDTLALSLTGDPTVAEGGAPSYTLAITSGDIPAGSTATVDLSITLPGGLTGAEAADFVESFLKDLQDAAETGVTVGTANTVGNVTTVGLTLSSTFDKSFTFTLPTLSDTLVEGSESFTVAASNAAASNGASATASGSVITTITDNDTLALSLTGDPTVAEGGAPSYTLAITSGDIPAGSTATVDLSITLPGGLTGAEAADFVESFLKDLQDAAETGVTVGTANTVGNVTTVGLTLSSTFDKSFTFTLPTLSDTLVEGSESFTVAASNAAASNGASATASGSVITTITDNDTLALSLTGDPTVAEGGAPSYTLAITSGDIPAGSTATVDLSITLPGGLTGAEAADFVESFLKDLQDAAETGVTVGTANTVGNVTTVGLTLSSTFDKSFTFTLPTLSDTLVEGSESFTVAASNAAASNGASATASGSVITTITDNDTLALSLTGDPTVAEGGAPSYTLAITSGDIPAGSTATVDLSITLPGGLTGAEAADFVESFLKDLQDAAETGVTVGTANTVGNVTTVGLTLSSTFDKSFTFTLPTLNDTLVEGSESFTVAASNAAASNGASATASGSVITTITDNDTATWSLTGSGSVTEGNTASYTVHLSGTLQSGENASILLSLSNVTTAADGSDLATEAQFDTAVQNAVTAYNAGSDPGSLSYDAATNKLTFTSDGTGAMGNLVIGLTAVNDNLLESNEQYSVGLASPGSGTGSPIALDPAHTLVTTTIIDNDPAAGAPITLDVDEAALPAGSNPSLTTEIDNTPSLSFTASGFNLVSFAFSSNLSGLQKDLNGDGTQDIFWVWDSGTQISGYLDAGHTQLADRLTLSAPASIAAGTTGNVTVTETLSSGLKHPTGGGAQVSPLGNVGVVATDTNGDTTTGTVNLTVKDDMPTANPGGGSGTSTFADTNLIINLDLSGSMDTADGPGGTTRLEAAKAAILELLEQYDALGNVKVELVTFSDSATDVSGGFVDIAAAKALILNFGTAGLHQLRRRAEHRVECDRQSRRQHAPWGADRVLLPIRRTTECLQYQWVAE